MGGLSRRLERLERRRRVEVVERAHRRFGEVLDQLSDSDMAGLILANTRACGAVGDGDPQAKFEASADVFRADPAAVAGMGEEAQKGVAAWREAGGPEAWIGVLSAFGDEPLDEELRRAIEEAREKHCKPRFHMGRAFPHLRGLP